MSAGASPSEALAASLLARLPAAVARPGYDRAALAAGMAHIGVGAFHRCHQADYTEDMLSQRFDRWGVVGINIREPWLGDTLGRQGGLYTRLLKRDDRVEARVVGNLVSIVDSQQDARPALSVLASSEIEVATLTVTEKGYCHRPADGALDGERPEIVHDLAHPEAPDSLPGLLVRALEMRMQSHGRPLTLVSCDNIPANGALLERVVTSLAERRGGGLAAWIRGNAAFPSTMVDRIVPATAAADIEAVERRFGYRDAAVVAGEPFRQWVIENRAAGRMPPWDLAGAAFVDDVTAFEHLKMRVLNAAQSTLATLGLLAGHAHTFEAVADPLLLAFVRRMLVEESVPTLRPVPGVDATAYVETSLERLRNRAIRHRNHQIGTDGSQKIVQRLLNPLKERLARGEAADCLTVATAGSLAYLLRASRRFGARWTAADPYAERIAGIAEASGGDMRGLVDGILGIQAIFDPALAANQRFRDGLGRSLAGLVGPDPVGFLKDFMAARPLKPARQTG